MALPATDPFTSGTNQALTAYSSSWTLVQGGFVVNTDGVCYGSVNQTNLARWNADTFASSHYAEGVIGNSLTGSNYPGIAVGCQSGAASGYYFIVASGGYNEFGRVNAGSDNPLDTTATQVWAVGDVMRMEISYPNGSTTRIVIKRAAAAAPTSFSTVLTYDDTSGSRLTGGSAGQAAYGNNAGISGLTSWTAGDIGGGGTTQDLAGAATGQGTATGAASVTKPLGGSGTGGGSATGALGGQQQNLAGGATGGVAASGSAAVSKPLAGGATGGGAATGAASVSKPLAGDAAGGSSASGAAAIAKPLGGAAAGQATASAALDGGATITTAALKNDSGSLLVGLTIEKLAALKVSDLSLAASWTNQATNGSGVLALFHTSLVPGADYLLVTCNADGSARGVKLYTAA